jgi:oligopeptide/dipeptide ABC transporter ATP-binding protein
MGGGNDMEHILRVKNLKTYFHTYRGVAKSVDGISFNLEKGKILGFVGESGSGKSVTALSIMGLIPSPPGKIEAESIEFDGKNLRALSKKELRKIRGSEISMVFQEPMTSLNPVLTIGEQITEVLLQHKKITPREAQQRAIELLELVNIPMPEARLKEYPHNLSGGMRQRIMIAIALACDPKLLIADEPTTALDVTIQAQILEILKQIREKFQTSIILITHDMGVIAEVTDYVAVMYCGKIVEYADTLSILKEPKHPYTRALINTIPELDEETEVLETIPGMVPSLYNLPRGCKFQPRCKNALPICSEKEPQTLELGTSKVSCWLYTDDGRKGDWS